MILFQKIIQQKLNNITVDELMQYAKQYQIAINQQQAADIVQLMRGKNINIFKNEERTKLLKEIAKITSPAVAQEVNQLFQKFTN
ncbi:DUF2624 domain-containing protein [Metabacillus arenae]|uniref:DUF2624 domain-containing protein n=1 Tax=Metabacillus arenae TaxID=2771434 RepID=A0A926RXQ2_9BACI|nr:DUF2624 domain-containing protein [Metabacillus arenae]MBD1382128.1 DUF2624 domain-containing protein [Metabacillus arenae]